MRLKKIEKITTGQKMREARLRWLGHVERQTEEDFVMEDGSGWTTNDMKIKTEVELIRS